MTNFDENDRKQPAGDTPGDFGSELESLRATLGELESADTTDTPAEQPTVTDTLKPAQPVTAEVPENTDRKAHTGEVTLPDSFAVHEEKKSRKPLFIALITAGVVLTAAAVAAILLLRPFGFADGSDAPTASGEVVVISDSELGDVEIQTVPGAKINVYDEENIAADDNGYLAYFENGKKTSSLGIDLSEYQGDIDFARVKAAGVDFVMLRIGGRYYSDEGDLYEDGAFMDNYEAAKAAGLQVGAYFFSQAASTDDAVEEANFSLNKLDGIALDYPIAFDWETIEDDTARTDVVTGEMLTVIAEAFCDTVEDAGYRSIVYANTSLMLHMYDFETMKDYDFWLADYREFPTMYYNFNIWQYTTDGAVDGIDGTVDLNVCFTPY